MSVTDPSAIQFSNERIRVAADMEWRLYIFCKELVLEWFGQGIGQKLGEDPNAILMDGSDVDGRNPINVAQATNIVTRAQEFIADMEANSNAKLNTILAVKVRR